LRILYLILFIFISQVTAAQSFNGFMHSDFSGIIGAQLQPANIAGSPYKYDFSLLNGNLFLTNNIAYSAPAASGNSLFRYLERDQKYLHANIALGGFSGMVSLAGNESLGFTYRIRAHASGIDFSPDLLIQFNRFSNPRFLNSQVTDQTGEFSTSLWREYALTYAKIIKDDGYHRWKMGASFKLINPRANAFVKVNDFGYTIDNNGVPGITAAELEFGYSDNLNDFKQFDGVEPLNRLPSLTGNRIGFDLGLVYERVAFREAPKETNGTSYEPDIDYEFKLSASITDIGTMKHKYGSASAIANGLLPTADLNNVDAIFDSLQSFRGFRDSLSQLSQVNPLSGEYTVSLPTTLNLGYDYSFGNHLFVGAHARVDLTSLIPTDYRLNYLHSLTLTPRWERQKKGIYTPIHINQLGDFHLGLAARYGPITIGTQSIGALLAKEQKTSGFFFSININQLKANAKKPYCFGASRGTAMTNTKRTPIYKRKKWLFF
jgi:hypothetical protein